MNIHLKRLFVHLLIPVCIILLLLAKNVPGFVEFYRRYLVVSWISMLYSRLIGLLPFSLAELILLLFPVLVGAGLVYIVVQLIVRDSRGRIKLILQSLINLSVAFTLLLTMFVVNCGVYYYRTDLATTLEYDTSTASEKELYEICVQLGKDCKEEREKIKEWSSFSEISKEAGKAYENLGMKNSSFSMKFGTPKSVYFSKYMSYTGIVGIFIPFTMEANVNTHVSPYTIPFSACHELGHMHGYMKEQDANFVAYLATMESENPELRYSASMHALLECKNALFDMEDDLTYWDMLDKQLDPAIKADFASNNEYWETIESSEVGEEVMETGTQVNDTYLKVNGQEDGVESYDRMVELMVGYARKNGWIGKK